MIIATAGHVDHGKTTLLQAITGVNADRLPEEKARGMTIDLGYAYWPQPDGRVLGFIDVPGHEKFLSNMLAGVGGIDHALLVVACDDGVMAQTREHLAILQLTGKPTLTVALTKTDRVAAARVAEVQAEVEQTLGELGFDAVAFFPTAAAENIGIAELRSHLLQLAERPRPAAGVTPPRDTLQIAPLRADDFILRVQGIRHGIARLRHIRGARFTQWGEVEVQVRDGKVQLPAGFSLIWVKHRHGRHQATPQIALLEGWGELRGAIATSYSHDSHNLVVLGRDANDMALAANQLIASGGGMALAQQGEILAHVAMPIAGMLSDLPAAELARQSRELRDLSSQVADWEPPYRVFKAIEGTCLACNAGPHLTDLGLTDGGSRQIVDPLIACREIPEPTDHNNNPQGA